MKVLLLYEEFPNTFGSFKCTMKFIRLDVFGRERFHYWGLQLRTFFRRPALVPWAVTFCSDGHHFRRTCLPLGL